MTDIVDTAAQDDLTVGTIESDTLTFTVPKDSPVEAERGKTEEKSFSFRQIATVEDAEAVIKAKEWALVDMVNKQLKANARSNAYQAAMAPHKVSDVPPEQVFERTVRDMVRQGIPETMARELLKNTLSAVKS